MVRTRFAPSPTGFLHVGGVRTALFAWLLAKQAGGQFILRIEDTDRSRHVEESEKHIMDCLQWLDLKWNEGPYRQSERLDGYREWARRLLDSGRAYVDTTSEAELEKLRQAAKEAKKPFLYRDSRPSDTPKWDGHKALRFKSEPKDYKWHDEVLGDLSTGPEVIDDFIIIKADGFPTYNFAHVVDDHLMKISHVIRSQEFLPSVPRFLNLYEALKIDKPKLATLPYVMAPDGKKKLSKRDGAKDILDYQKEGYLPEALINFLATLGWNDGTDQEIFSVEELIAKFRLQRVQKGGAKFDEQRLSWMNGHYFRQMPLDELYERSEGFWPRPAASQSDDYKKAILGLLQERLKHLSELGVLTNFFFEEPAVELKLIDDNKQLKDLGHEQQKLLLEKSKLRLEAAEFSVDKLTQTLNLLREETDQSPAVLFSLIRIATTWSPASPELAGTLAVLGKQKSLARLDQAIAALAS